MYQRRHDCEYGEARPCGRPKKDGQTKVQQYLQKLEATKIDYRNKWRQWTL